MNQGLSSPTAPPLPKGEGWGEGEENIQCFTTFATHRQLADALCIDVH